MASVLTIVNAMPRDAATNRTAGGGDGDHSIQIITQKMVSLVHAGCLLTRLMSWPKLCSSEEETLLIFKAQHRRYVFPIWNKFFLTKTTHTKFILFLVCLTLFSLAPNDFGPCLHNSTKPQHWKYLGVLHYLGERSRNDLFSVFNFGFGCLVLRRHIACGTDAW